MFDTPYMFPTDDFRRFPFWYFVGREFDSFGKPADKNMLTESFQNALPDLIDSDDLTLLNQILRRKYRDYLVRDHYFVTSKVETIHYTETVKTNFEINFNAPADITVENLRFANTWAYTINIPEWSYSYYDKAVGDVGNVKTVQPKSFIFDDQNEQAIFKCVVDPSAIEGDLTWNLISNDQTNPVGWVSAWTCQVNCQHTVFPQEYKEDLFNLYRNHASPEINTTAPLPLLNEKNLISSPTWFGIGPTNIISDIQLTLELPKYISYPAPINKPAVIYFNLKDDLNLYPNYVKPYGETKVESYEGFQYSDKTVYAQQFQIDYTPPAPYKTSTVQFNKTSEQLLEAWINNGSFDDKGSYTPPKTFTETYNIINITENENQNTDSGLYDINTESDHIPAHHNFGKLYSEVFYVYVNSSYVANPKGNPITINDINNSKSNNSNNIFTLTVTNNTKDTHLSLVGYAAPKIEYQENNINNYPCYVYASYDLSINEMQFHGERSQKFLVEENKTYYCYVDDSKLPTDYSISSIINWYSNAIKLTEEKPDNNLIIKFFTSKSESGIPEFTNKEFKGFSKTIIEYDNVNFTGTSIINSGTLTYIFSTMEGSEHLINVPSINVSYNTTIDNISGTVKIPENNQLLYSRNNIPDPIAYGDTNYLIFYAPDSPASWTKYGFENLINANAVWLITSEDPRGKPEYEHIFGLWTLTVSNDPFHDDQIRWTINDFTSISSSYTNPEYNPFKATASITSTPLTVTYQEHKDEQYNLTIGDLYQKEIKVETPLPLKPPEDTSEESTSMGLDAEWTKAETFDRTREETVHKFEPFVDETLKVLENVSIQLAKIHGTEWKAYKKASEVYYSYIVEEGLAYESLKETEQDNGTETYSPNLKTTKDTTNTQTDNYTTEGNENYSTDTTGIPKEEHSGGIKTERTPTLLKGSVEENGRTANDVYDADSRPDYVPQTKSTISNTYSADKEVSESIDTTVKQFTTDNHETGKNTSNITNNGTSELTGKSTENTTGTAETTKHDARDRQLKRIRTPWKTIEDVWNNPEYEWLFKIADDIAEELFIQSYSF